jgi:hypothetical protein
MYKLWLYENIQINSCLAIFKKVHIEILNCIIVALLDKYVG